MGIRSRFALLVRARASAELDRREDPRETLDYAYAEQQELLRKVRQGLVEVMTARRRLERLAKLRQDALPRLEEQAHRAVVLGRDDLARLALERRQAALAETQELGQQITELAGEEQRLVGTERSLAARIEEFRSRRVRVATRYTAAEARARVGEALTGLSDETAELGAALGRAEERIEQMEARADSFDVLTDPALTRPLPGGDAVAAELRRMGDESAIEAQLAALKHTVTEQLPAELPVIEHQS
jgi:phage shock protein A